MSTTGEVVLQGFSIPSILTRKAQTTLELRNGQTFAMAGLISRNVNAINSRIPGLGDLPVLGAFFRSVRYENDETELVVLVTATLVEPLSTGQCPPLPGDSHVCPTIGRLYGLGEIEEGQRRPKLSKAQAAWLKDSGLSKLRGPGGWSKDAQRSAQPASPAGKTPPPKPGKSPAAAAKDARGAGPQRPSAPAVPANGKPTATKPPATQPAGIL